MPSRNTTRRNRVWLASLLALLVVGTSGILHATEDSDAESVAGSAVVGRATYRVYCASCHGASGEGDGTIAEHLRIPPSDLTRIAERNGGVFPVDEVTEIIDGRTFPRTHGSKEMPVWGDAFHIIVGQRGEEAVRDKIHDLTAYLSSIQAEPADEETYPDS